MHRFRNRVFWFIGFVVVFGSTWFVRSILRENSEIVVRLELQSNDSSIIQLFFNDGRPFTKVKTQVLPCYPNPEFQYIYFKIPKSYNIKNIRFDFGKIETEYKLRSVVLADNYNSIVFDALHIKENFETNNFIKNFEYDQVKNLITIQTYAGDPYIFIEDVKDKFDVLRMNYLMVILLVNILLWIELLIYITILINGHDFKRLKSNFIHLDYRKWFSISFVVLLFSPFVIQALGVFSTTKNMENRHLTEYPDVNETGYFDYLGAFSGYFEDHFGLRTQMIALNNYVHFLYLNETASQRNVEYGHEGWLYVTAYLQSAYFRLFSQAELGAIQTTLTQRGEFLNNLGIKYYLLIPPTKASAYMEFRPKFYQKFSKLQNVENVIGLFDSTDFVRTTKLQTAIQQTKEVASIPIYYKYDSHWNSMGAKVGYDMLMRTIKKDFPNISPIPNESYEISFDSTYEADLAMNIAIGDIVPRSEVVYTLKGGSNVKSGTPKPYGHFAIFKDNVTGDSIKVLMFHDSFGVALMPFLSETFSQSTFLWTTDFRYDIIEKEQPDIVIQERMESYLIDFVSPNTPEFLERLEWSRTLNNSIPE